VIRKRYIAVLNSVRYKNPTPNPLPASREGAFDVPHVIRKRYSSQQLDKLTNFHYILLNVRHPGWAATSEDYQNLVNQLKNQSNFDLKYQRDDVYLFVKQ
jgi:hypothetical protein